ncbi:ProQ/FINO family protein [uncultured Xylophilus sp.]|uniref:ProQ/FINO family protein n=1 Tax=uncultured Xylophilus sp. TaxID=296832 RepID=UPI0025CEB742|nr:ProQ/FINO family protein [uncultured Xylophilus sp.]
MTDSVSDAAALAPDASGAQPLASAAPDTAPAAVSDAAPAAEGPGQDARPRRSGGRGGRGGKPRAGGAPAAAPAAGPRAGRPVPPALEQLAALYPALFGADFLPLKRGIFQDILAAHPDAFARDALKEALGQHTRSTRYLQSVANARPRHDLQAQPVEDLAPEHVHQAIVELWRRRLQRTPAAEQDALRSQWRARVVRAYEASGLDRDTYAERVRTRDAAAGALLDEALAEAGERAAKDEALLRAFEAGHTTVEAFAEMYGLDPRQAAQLVERARRRRDIAARAAAAARQDAPPADAPVSDADPA